MESCSTSIILVVYLNLSRLIMLFNYAPRLENFEADIVAKSAFSSANLFSSHGDIYGMKSVV